MAMPLGPLRDLLRSLLANEVIARAIGLAVALLDLFKECTTPIAVSGFMAWAHAAAW
jgi:hypothetical protein